MNLNQKIVVARRAGGVVCGFTDREMVELIDRGYTRPIRSTDRWVLTGAGMAAARMIEAELSAAELAEIGGVR